MKNFEKILLALFFLIVNAVVLFVISRFYQLSWGILAGSLVTALVIVELPTQIRNYKIRKAIREKEEKRKEVNRKEREIQQQKAEKAKNHQRRMTERNIRK